MPISLYFDTLFAQSGDKSPVPDAAQSSGTVSYQQGYTPPYSLAPSNPDAILVGRSNFNQLLYDVTAAIQQIQQFGAPPFITSTMNGGSPFSYTLGAIVSYNAGSGIQTWISAAAANTTTPGAMGATWNALGSTPINLYTGGTSGGSANAQTVATNQGNFSNTTGNIVTWKAGYSVNQASTLDPDADGNITIKVMTQTGVRDTTIGDIIVNGEYMAISDGTYLQLINPSSTQIAQPEGGINHGRKISWASNTTLNVSAASIIMKNAAGQTVKASNPTTTINAATNGANGLDTGSLGSSTWYYVWGIYNPATSTYASLLSLSSTAPTLPSGYTYSALLGAALTDGSSHFIGFIQIGNKWRYQVGNNLSGVPNMSSGAQGNPASSYVAISVSAFVPPIASEIAISISGGNNQAITAIVSPNANWGFFNAGGGSAPPYLLYNSADGAGGGWGWSGLTDMILESSNVYYASGGTSWLLCYGFSLNL